VLSLDCSYGKSDAGDYSAAVIIGEVRARRAGAGPGYYVLHVVRGRWSFGQLKSEVLDLAHLWQPYEILIEDTASGQSLIQELKYGTALRIRPVKVSGDKQYRAAAASPAVESRLVYLQAGAAWVGDFLDEVCGFPSAPFDDQLDAFTQCINYLRGRPEHRVRIADLRTGQRLNGGSDASRAPMAGAERVVCRDLISGQIMYDSKYDGRPPIIAALPDVKPGSNVCERCQALMSPYSLRTFSPVIGENDDRALIYGSAERLCAVCVGRAVDNEHRTSRVR
jgi:predicted phage terminase large subunit-like protein